MAIYQRVFKPIGLLDQDGLSEILDILVDTPLGVFLIPIRNGEYYALCGVIDEEDDLTMLETAVQRIGVFDDSFVLSSQDWQTISAELKKKEEFLRFSLEQNQRLLAKIWKINQTR